VLDQKRAKIVDWMPDQRRCSQKPVESCKIDGELPLRIVSDPLVASVVVQTTVKQEPLSLWKIQRDGCSRKGEEVFTTTTLLSGVAIDNGARSLAED
jgi:hypothetical protein